MELDIKKLNKKQKEAVVHEEGPVLIVAGAGTGKTTVITDRLAYLIDKKKAKPEEILAVTFTDKAAKEMEDRVTELIPGGYSDLWISTFHAFCNRVLQENGLDIGLSTDFKLVNETDAWLLVKQNFDKFDLEYYKPRGNPNKFIKALLNHFSRCKDQEISAEDYLEYSKKEKGEDKDRIKEVANAYNQYQQLLLDNDSMDFGDLINYCLQLFKERPLILEKYRKKFKYILVDEFQDTNWAQYELVKLLAEPENNLTVCADDDQAIYRFRGASFGNILQFKKDFPKAKEVFLVKNYRSLQSILDLAYNFIQLNNPNRLEHISKISKRLLANDSGIGKVEHLHYNTSEEELDEVINKIIELLKKDKLTYSDFAILTRTNDSANKFARACERRNLPYQFLASKGLYSKLVILDIISYFKLLDNYHESSALYRVLGLPFLEIPVEDIAKITHHSYKGFKSVYESLQELPLINVSSETKEKITNLLSLIEKHTKIASHKNVSKVLLAFMEDFGYWKHLVKENKSEDIGYTEQFFRKIKNFEEANDDARLKNFMIELELELESGEEGSINFDPNAGPDVVSIMTVHRAKGLEFPYVFLINLVDRKFPLSNRKEPIEIPEGLVKDVAPEGDMHLEEERRLFYVGITRAKKGIFLTSAEDYGGKTLKKLSRFLIEMGYDKEITKTKKGEMLKVEKKEVKENLPIPNKFSFSGLSNYEVCPYKYKLGNVLRIPTPGKAVFSFGRSMHNTLYDFVGKSAEGKVSLEELMNMYKDRWIDEWFNNKEQRDEYYELGKESLKTFYNNFSKRKEKVFIVDGKPALEQKFVLKMGDNILNGSIDRVDEVDGGVEIIDYKTGKVKEKLDAKDKKQLLIYQIAAEEVFGLKVKKLTYHYLDEGKELEFLGSEKDKVKEKERITSLIDNIKKSNFIATPGFHCQYCDYKNICPYAQK